MREYPELLEPLLFYVLHRVNGSVTEPGSGAVVEAVPVGRSLAVSPHPMFAPMSRGPQDVAEAERRVMMATQASEDFAASALLRAVLESCPTTLLLANPALDPSQHAELFRLNALELDRLTRLTPRRELLLKRPPHTSKVLTLDVDAPPRGGALYATGPGQSRARRAAPARGRLCSTGGPGPADRPRPRGRRERRDSIREDCLALGLGVDRAG